MVDLKAAYLQIKVAEDLWKHQLVRWRGKVYCLTRLGFGLNVAPKVMTKVLKTVLKEDEEVASATSSYIDDIYVDVSRVDAERVVEHLKNYGLESKPPATMDDGAALGLTLRRGVDGKLKFSRGNEIPEAVECMTRRELFSACGKLIGHYPVAGWLRVACSYVKRHAEGEKWSDSAGKVAVKRLKEVIERLKKDDPVGGKWQVEKTEVGKVWCDASDLAMGAVVEIGGDVVEDAAWMRKKNDYNHINVAELEAVMKGINLGVQWGLKKITVVTDSATVSGWIKVTLSEEKRVKTKGAAEVLVKRRLGVLKTLVSELGLTVSVQLVRSECNKADILTRVKREWMTEEGKAGGEKQLTQGEVKALHEKHHMGVERSWFLAKKLDPGVSKDLVKEVVRSCTRCQSIDPAPVTHEGGDLEVRDSWNRLAIDVTHFRGQPYLTILDCGPGRFAIWRRMGSERAGEISRELEQIFYERGPPEELLMDNATAFRSSEMADMMERWGVRPFFRAAYRPSGNGIVERNHRTIKAMAERGDGNPIEAVFWYNNSPRDRQKEESVPRASIFRSEWRMPGEVRRSEEASAKVKVGDEVWVKPPDARCTSQWGMGKVTKVNSKNNVEVEGVPRHILDIRPVRHGEEGGEGQEVVGEEQGVKRYPSRHRAPPRWLQDDQQGDEEEEAAE